MEKDKKYYVKKIKRLENTSNCLVKTCASLLGITILSSLVILGKTFVPNTIVSTNEIYAMLGLSGGSLLSGLFGTISIKKLQDTEHEMQMKYRKGNKHNTER